MNGIPHPREAPPSKDGASRGAQLLGNSRAMVEVDRLIALVAQTDAPVLLLGPSGCGKTAIARVIHNCSRRKAREMVEFDCTTLTENLAESELLGIASNVATGVGARAGVFEQADESTIFLDEIGDMTLRLQAKLLRAIREKRIRRVGGQKDISVDVRVIAATNKNMGWAVVQREFREDLFYRLNVFQIVVPALKERADDIPMLVAALMQRHCATVYRTISAIAPEALSLLSEYDWPGNIGELESVIQSAMVLECTEVLGREAIAEALKQRRIVRDQDASSAGQDSSPQQAEQVQKAESDDLDDAIGNHIASVLEKTGGNQSRAARKLGIPRSRLTRFIKEHPLVRQI